ncbi:hypothetical protein [Pedobacter sp. NJ-S-72]
MKEIFDTNKSYILENDYVQLRPLEMSDFETLKAFGVGEAELWITLCRQ